MFAKAQSKTHPLAWHQVFGEAAAFFSTMDSSISISGA